MEDRKVDRKPVTVKIGGEELAKVLMYYDLIESTRMDQKIVCPFHEDLNPSMKIDLEKGTYFCFGCEASGDALNFVVEICKKYGKNKLDELESCILYFKILKSKEVKSLKIKHKTRVKKESKQSLIEAEDYYYGLSKVDWINGDSEEIIRCRSYMSERGFTPQILQEIGAKVTYDRYYPIVFPIMDNGIFKGWVERTDNKRVEKLRKYLYNDGFSKNQTLAGEYTKTHTVVLCEGYMDMLKLRMLGYKKVVAIMGWHISDVQVKKLKEAGIKTIISALDADEYGIKGTKLLKQYFQVVRFQYPEGVSDPGELNEHTFRVADKRTRKKYKEEIKRYGRN